MAHEVTHINIDRIVALAAENRAAGLKNMTIDCDAAVAFAAVVNAAIEAENALLDYIPTLERKKGTSLNYGHGVLRALRSALMPFGRE